MLCKNNYGIYVLLCELCCNKHFFPKNQILEIFLAHKDKQNVALLTFSFCCINMKLPTKIPLYRLLLPLNVIEMILIIFVVRYDSVIRSKAILHCNANDCIHQMSFVSYSLCSLSFLSKTSVHLLWAQRCVNSSITHCKMYPYQTEQGTTGMTCQVTASSLVFLTPLCRVSLFVLIMWSVSPSLAQSARPSPTSGRIIWNVKDLRAFPTSFL